MANLYSTTTVRSTIAIEETETRLRVTVPIPSISAENLEIRIAPQSLLLRGEQMEQVKIDGYCDFSYPAVQFHKLLGLPHPVQPESVTVTFREDALILTLHRSVAIPYREFCVNGLGEPLILSPSRSRNAGSMR